MDEDLDKKIEDAKAQDEAENQTQQKQDDKDAKIEELTGQLARAMADMQNFKRRSEEEKASFVKFANAEMLKMILPILDNLDRSVSHLPDELKDNEWAKGMRHIHADLLKTFEKLNITKVKTVGEKLDPNKHEALMAGPGEVDMIVEEFEPGYMIGDEVLKVAKVKVGDGLPESEKAESK